MKKIDIKVLLAEIESEQIDRKVGFRVINEVAEVLKSFDGKAINKRIQTAIQKKYPNYCVSLDSRYLINIAIWGDGIKYDDRIRVFLGYGDNPVFNFEKFVEWNQCHFLEASRLEKLNNRINTLPELVERWNQLVETAESVISEAGGNWDNYPVSKYFSL